VKKVKTKLIKILLIKFKILKIISFVVFISFIIIATGAIAFINFFPKETLQNLIASNIESGLNRKIHIEGLDYNLTGIVLKKIILFDGKTKESPILASADDAGLGFSIMSLLKKELNINRIFLKNLHVNIVYDSSGKSNIEKFLTADSAQSSESGMSARISSIRLDNAEIKLVNAPEYLKPLEGNYNFNGIIEFDKNKNINLKKCKIKLPNERGIIYPAIGIIFSAADFEINGHVGLEKVSLLWTYKWGSYPYQPYGFVSGDVKNLIINRNKVEGFIAASSTLTNSKKIVFADGFCKVDLNKKTVFISDTKGKINTSTFLINTLQFTTSGHLIKFNFTNIDAYVTDITPVLKKTLSFFPDKIFGKISGDFNYQKNFFNGNLKITNAGYDSREKIISGLTTGILLKNNSFKIENIPVRILGNDCSVSIATTENSFRKLFVNITTDKFRYMSDLKNNEKLKSVQKNRTSIPLAITGKIIAKKLYYDSHEFNHLKLNYIFNKNKIKLNNFSFNYSGGNIAGTGNISTADYPPRGNANIKFSDIKIQDLVSKTKNFKNRFFGIANGKTSLRFLISSNILNTLYGRTEFTIDRGKVVDTGIQNGLGILLSSLKHKLKDLEFKKIYGNINIDRTNYVIKSFIFNSHDVRLKLQGLINNKLIAQDMNINLEFTKHFIKDLTLSGAISYSLKKNLRRGWYVIPFKVNGDITESKNISLIQ